MQIHHMMGVHYMMQVLTIKWQEVYDGFRHMIRIRHTLRAPEASHHLQHKQKPRQDS